MSARSGTHPFYSMLFMEIVDMERRVYFQLPQMMSVFTLVALVLSLVGCSGGTTTTPTGNGTTAIQQPTSQQVTTVPPEPPGAAPAGPEDSGTTVPQDIQMPVSTGYPVKVYFSKFPDSLSNFQAVFPVDRVSPTIMVGTFALQLLIAGPTPKEWDAGYFSELNSILTGPSNCSAPHPVGGPDFKLALNMKGSTSAPQAALPEQGTATVQFCRSTASPGIGADARIITEITATLKQFPSVKKVVILTKDGHCFGDLSGQDMCLK
jgi:hypothetical protein